MKSKFCYKKDSNKLLDVVAWIVAGVSVALWVMAYLGMWFWGALITVLIIAPEAFTELAFAKRFACLLILWCPISYLFSGALELIVNKYFRERV